MCVFLQLIQRQSKEQGTPDWDKGVHTLHNTEYYQFTLYRHILSQTHTNYCVIETAIIMHRGLISN